SAHGCSVVEFYAQLEALESAFNSVLHSAKAGSDDPAAVLRKIHLALSRVFVRVMERTANFYEQAVETAPMGLCEVDSDGTLLYSNSAMSGLLRTVASSHRKLTDFFAVEDRAFVADALRKASGGEAANREVKLQYPDGTFKPVWLTFRPLMLDG